MSDMKTPEELRSQISYYEDLLKKTTSPDRIRRATVKISRLRIKLQEAESVTRVPTR